MMTENRAHFMAVPNECGQRQEREKLLESQRWYHGEKKKSPSSTTAAAEKTTKCAKSNCSLSALLQHRKCYEASRAAQKLKQTAPNYAPHLGQSGISSRASSNDYLQLEEMPPPMKTLMTSQPKRMEVNGKISSSILADESSNNHEENGYCEIGEFSTTAAADARGMGRDLLRLKNRQLLISRRQQRQQSANDAEKQGEVEKQKEVPRNFGGSNANIYGLCENIEFSDNATTKEGPISRSNLDLTGLMSHSRNTRFRSNSRPVTTPGAFPTCNAPNSPVCKKIMASSSRRALSPSSPSSAGAGWPFASARFRPQFNRALSCQNLTDSQSTPFGQNWSHQSPLARDSSFLAQNKFPAMRIEPPPNLPRRSSSREAATRVTENRSNILQICKSEEQQRVCANSTEEEAEAKEEAEAGDWQKAELNLKQLINTLETAVCGPDNNDNSMELGRQNANSADDVQFDEKYDQRQSVEGRSFKDHSDSPEGDYAEIGQFVVGYGKRRTFTMNTFMRQFMASDVRQLAAWMSEADCRAFGWPPSQQSASAGHEQQQQQFFWSLSARGQQIRAQIEQRSALIRSIVQKSLQQPAAVDGKVKVLEKWISLAEELYSSLGNHFGFMNILDCLVEKPMPTEMQPNVAQIFLIKLLPAHNRLKSNEKGVEDASGTVLLPHLAPLLAPLFGTSNGPSNGRIVQAKRENFGAKIDLLWTFTRLARQMLANAELHLDVQQTVVVDGKLEDDGTYQELLGHQMKQHLAAENLPDGGNNNNNNNPFASGNIQQALLLLPSVR